LSLINIRGNKSENNCSSRNSYKWKDSNFWW